MEVDNEKIYQTVKESFQEVLDLNDELKRPDTIDRQTPIYGRDATFDSLALITFLVTVEGKIREQCRKPVSLNDERAMSQKHSPFRTIETLVNYIEQRLQEK